jgi:hypothetical protein
MENSGINITGEFKKGVINIKEFAVSGEWKTYFTDKQNIIFLRAFLHNEIKEGVYDVSLENFAEALKRILQNK